MAQGRLKQERSSSKMSQITKDLKYQKTYTSTNYNKGKRIPELMTDDCLFEIFERTADKYPENVAVSIPARDYTYCEIEKGANKMAWFLKNKGIRKGGKDCYFSEKFHRYLCFNACNNESGSLLYTYR